MWLKLGTKVRVPSENDTGRVVDFEQVLSDRTTPGKRSQYKIEFDFFRSKSGRWFDETQIQPV